MVTPSAVVYFKYTTTRVSLNHNSHTFCSFLCLWFETGPFVVVFVFVAPFSLLAVFRSAYKFDQDVSNWNTGAVTTMEYSKCTPSPSLWPRLPLLCFLNLQQLEFHRITILTRSVLLFCVCETAPFCCCLWWVGLSFLCCTLSCSVLECKCVQSGFVQMEYGYGDKYVSK